MSVEKSFDFFTDFYVFARFENGKDLEKEISLEKVFILSKNRGHFSYYTAQKVELDFNIEVALYSQ